MAAVRTPSSVPVPTWQRVVAWTAFLVTVPSAPWRLLMIVGLLPGTADLRAYELAPDPRVGHAYVATLSALQLGCGLLTVGLVRPWGERVGSRRVPVVPVVAIGTLGGLLVTYLFDVTMATALLTGHRPDADLDSG